jgi:segregation and condensation protein A
MEQRIFDIIFKGDEVTWQSLIQDLVRVENMDPWDVDITSLTQKYIAMLKKMQELDLRISGKVVLAAAILLRMKSNYLMDRDLLNFDKLMHPEEYTDDALYDDPQQKPRIDIGDVRLIPKTPQPRKRKVSIYELVDALKQALEVKKRRRQILDAVNIPLPGKKIDISIVIEDLFNQIEKLFSKDKRVTFSQLVPSKDRKEIISLFLPVLHLSNQQRVVLEQYSHFGEIDITLPNGTERKTGSATNKKVDFDEEFDFVGDALEESDKKKR